MLANICDVDEWMRACVRGELAYISVHSPVCCCVRARNTQQTANKTGVRI